MTPQKYSKSNQDPNQVDKDREALSEMDKRTSQHFAVGTDVIYYKHKYTILAYHGPWVVMVGEKGRIALKEPWFMQWHSN